MRHWFRYFAILVLPGALLSMAPFDADLPSQDDQDVARAALTRGDVLPLRTILAKVARRVPGEPVKVELEIEHRRLIYEVKVLMRGGRLRKVRFDARNGAFIGVEDDD